MRGKNLSPKTTHRPDATPLWCSGCSIQCSKQILIGWNTEGGSEFHRKHAEVFQRVGASTDVVRKEMYELTDRGDRRLALRPEGTAPIVRAYVEHRPTPPWKVWYLAPNFRYERPQRGRYRQHWELGAELLGVDDPDVDVEVIALAHGFYRDFGITGVRLLLNSMGTPEDRRGSLVVLQRYLLEHAAGLGEEFRVRAKEHPLRLLDTKDEQWQEVIERAPHSSCQSRKSQDGINDQ